MKIARPRGLAALFVAIVACDSFAHYDPNKGRFLSRDPIEEAGGAGLHGFVLNDPVNRADPLGLWPTPIHNQIADKALPELSNAERGIIKDRSLKVDSVFAGGQNPSTSYQHAMRSRMQPPKKAEKQMKDYIAQHLEKAKRLQDEWFKLCKDGYSAEALDEFGYAFHTLTDSTSPTHVGFQVWAPGNVPLVIKHMRGETTITDDQLRETVAIVESAFASVFSGNVKK